VSAWRGAWDDGPSEPWAQDPDAWRGADVVPGGWEHVGHAVDRSWPQLDATPLYWMWCQRLERERGIDE
jgi:hypothetical protein